MMFSWAYLGRRWTSLEWCCWGVTEKALLILHDSEQQSTVVCPGLHFLVPRSLVWGIIFFFYYFRSWCYEIVSFFLQCLLKNLVYRHLDPSITCYNNAIHNKMQSMVMWNRELSFQFHIVNIQIQDLFAQGLELWQIFVKGETAPGTVWEQPTSGLNLYRKDKGVSQRVRSDPWRGWTWIQITLANFPANIVPSLFSLFV